MHDGEAETGINTPAIDQDRAGATLAVVAAFLGAGQAEVFAQGVEQRHPWLQLQFVFFAVDLQGHGDHGRAIGNVEGLLEFHQIREWAIGAVTRGRMRIRVHLQLQIFITLHGAPDLRETEEESLLWGETVDLLVSCLRIFIECFLQRGVCDLDSANVGDVLSLGEFTINVHAGERFIFRILIHDSFPALVVFLG